jgi:cytidylate kinase
MRDGLTIAIDGPAGAGKSTLARRLADTLGLPYVNTGQMYRAVADRALDEGVESGDGSAVAGVARTIRFSLSRGHVPELEIDGVRPGHELTSPEVEATVSAVSRHPEVRRILRQEQRRLCEGRCVMEGRDIGTVVLPEADLKIFLSAEPDARADRRERERGGDQLAGDAVAERDAQDARTNPLIPASDAYVLNTTSMDADEVFLEALRLVRVVTGTDPGHS